MLDREIPNEKLSIADIPASDAGWPGNLRFALTFNGYAHFPDCAEIANQRRHTTLSEIRACLFFEAAVLAP